MQATETSLSLTGLSELSKKQLTIKAEETALDVYEQGGDGLSLISVASKVKHFATELEKAAKNVGLSDLEKYEKTGVAKEGVQLKIKETGVNYDYSADPVWRRLMGEVNAAKGKLAEWEEFLKKIPREGQSITDENSGEIYTARPPVRTAKTSIEATIL